MFNSSVVKNFLGLCFFVFFWMHSPQAQERICLSHEKELSQRVRFPKMGTQESFEEQLSNIISASRSLRAQNQELIIPIIIHIIHDGELIGTGDNISGDLIASQIEQLNNDFRKKAGTSGDNDNPVGADTFISFAPAHFDPNGNLLREPGINRLDRNDFGWTEPPYDGTSSDYIDDVIKPDSYWDTDSYLNVWAMSLKDNLLGYAQFPNLSDLSGLSGYNGEAETDGVVIRLNSIGGSLNPNPFGGFFDMGRTLTHEIGHFLGLRHIWGDGDCSRDDYVDDTPLQAYSSKGCPTDQSSCGFVDMVENYMDYSSDLCMNIFTLGQKERMDAVLTNSPRRNSLLSSKVHLAPFSGLILSEIVTGTGQGLPRYVEIHNASDEAYDLSSLELRIYPNGSINLSNTIHFPDQEILESGESFIISQASFDPAWGGAFQDATPDMIDPSFSGNGNETIQLFDKGSERAIDGFGVIGEVHSDLQAERAERRTFVYKANYSKYESYNWDFESYSHPEANPGSHLAEMPSFDPVLVKLEGVESDGLYNVCDGSLTLQPIVSISNAGGTSFDEVMLAINFNGTETNVLATFDSPISPQETGTFILSPLVVSTTSQNSFSVKIDDQMDQNPTNNTDIDYSFSVDVSNNGTGFSVITKTDQYPEETSWEIRDDQLQLVYNQEDFQSNTINETFTCLEDGSYTIALLDSWGDGIFSGYLTLQFGDDEILQIKGDDPTFDATNSETPRQVSLPFEVPFPPGAPSDLEVIAETEHSIALSWTDNSSLEESFSLEQSEGSSNIWVPVNSDIPANRTSYIVDELEEGTEYSFRLKSLTGDNSSNWSNETIGSTLLEPVEAFSASSISSNEIHLSWTDTSDKEDAFELQRSLSRNGSWTVLSNDISANETSFEDSNLQSETSYYYRIRTSNTTSLSEWSEVAMATTVVLGTDFLGKNQLLVYPNPSASRLTIQQKIGEELKVQVMSLSGQLLLSREMSGELLTVLDISEFPTGLYFIRFSNQSGETHIRRIIKKNSKRYPK